MLSPGKMPMIYAIAGVLLVATWILILAMKGVHKD